ncbi:REP-associated tyrosine transposase [Tenacibaculum sp. IB213877]|uniref:REP-associated tyrosine transposase n=1 Tax=Tenacibaculum sp. IB213877 TaxID=3097351 RepID=UPI002A5992D2|nr:transposase [Tenacibaculum sp. IB213877]MDY0780889.1 transposase [Tenacibaculum sp. IB213877]
MSQRYKVIDSTTPTFVTITVIDWVDVFIRPIYFKILDDSLNYCIKHKGLHVHAYVYMSSHLHMIISSNENELQDIIRDFKKFTSKEIIKAIKEYPESRREWLLAKFSFAANRIRKGKNYKVWKDGFHPIVLDNHQKIEQRISYIHYNPVASELVYHPRDWVNSSYIAYEDDNKECTNITIKPLW